ncbi:energy transducer TonB [Pseudothauera nasutitermitis]|uniref:Protein TonB n=1 Tax=Pseudothauera nasutitermitis TaxID=2565930 RepID=A0A4S4ASH3_9RHOO|nr:energy transducer TonB [Pseudothauera nasutitermitis]THF62794.1 energy transducer TonB [Pseudothauera nasutitermitis]
MSYATQQRDPRRHLIGIVFVIVLHVIVVYALINGLGREVVEVFKAPLDVRLIEELKPPPLPPPPPPSEIRKIVARPRPAPPPPAYVPPPEVVVETPAEPAPTIIVTQAEPPPPAPPAPPAPAQPVAAAIGVACPNHLAIRSSVPYPRQALRRNLAGDVRVEFVVDTSGAIGNVRILESSNPVFDDAVLGAVRRLKCVGQGQPVRVSVPFRFALDG